MAAIRKTRKKIPVEYPSVPDISSKQGKSNEPAIKTKADVAPKSRFKLSIDSSPADLRLHIEQLLMRRDTPKLSAWEELGEPAREMLVKMLDDHAVRSYDPLFHQAIVTIGLLAIKDGVAPLGAILTSKKESDLSKAYAASSLGRLLSTSAMKYLTESISDKSQMVRRQVAKALARFDDADVIPPLLKLQSDESITVAEVATESLQSWEKNIKKRVGAKNTKRGKVSKPRAPSAE